MSKATEIAARAAKLSERQGGRLAADRVDLSPPNVPRAKPVRITTDLAPQDYRRLVSDCVEIAEMLDRPKVSQADVVRALLARLRDDASLKAVVVEEVRLRLP